MNPNSSNHIKAILQALFVTFLWSTSFVIIKLGLDEIPPLTFAGLRYFVAFICLLPFALSKKRISEFKQIEKRDWLKLIWLGILFITVTQGAQFIGLSLLPAVTVSLLLNFSSAVVAVMAIFFLKEYPSVLQWSGMALFIIGALIYFYPVVITADQSLGLVIMMIGVIANAGSAVLGRGINREMRLSPFVVTIVSMGIGSIILLSTGIVTQGFLPLTLRNVAIILWLAGINTAFAFVLWNLTLRTLSAMESSIINNTMLIQIAILAWIFIDEPITLKEGIGMLIAAAGAVLVQWRKRKS